MEELIPIIMFMCIAAVLILRPLTKRLGMVIEQAVKDRQTSRVEQAEVSRLQTEIDYLSKRLNLVEERAEFTERLVGASRRMGATSDTVGATRAEPLPVDERQFNYLRR